MHGRFLKGITTGAILGAAAGVMIIPNMDRKNRKKLKKTGRMIKNSAEDMYDNVIHWVK